MFLYRLSIGINTGLRILTNFEAIEFVKVIDESYGVTSTWIQ